MRALVDRSKILFQIKIRFNSCRTRCTPSFNYSNCPPIHLIKYYHQISLQKRFERIQRGKKRVHGVVLHNNMIRGCVNILAAIVSFCVSILALIIVVFVSVKLTDVGFDGVNYDFQCLLGTNTSLATFTSNNCLMLQILGGLTIGLGLLIGIIQCYTCNLCGLGGILDGIFSLCGTGAWGYAAGVINHAVDSNGQLRSEYDQGNLDVSSVTYDVSQVSSDIDTTNNQRNATRIMCWIEFGFFCFLLLASVLKCCPGRHK